MKNFFSKLYFGFWFLKETIVNFFSNKKVFYMVESSDWSIKHDGENVIRYNPLPSKITICPFGIRNSIVHFGSINTLFFDSGKVRRPHKSNKVVVTWFHIVPGDKTLDRIKSELNEIVDLWHTSCSITKKELIDHGVPEDKIVLIPLGIDLECFHPPGDSERRELRKSFNIPEDAAVIGSFQKDGVGWGEGLEPKKIKGPDLFCDVVENLARKHPVFVLLTGPSRGYVKKRLEKAGIQYLHKFLASPQDVAPYYKLLDLYVVSSRAEGGPKAVLESLASGVPLVTTKVGMAPDLIIHKKNGILCDIENSKQLEEGAEYILNNPEKRDLLIANGLETAKEYTLPVVVDSYYKNIYSRLIK